MDLFIIGIYLVCCIILIHFISLIVIGVKDFIKKNNKQLKRIKMNFSELLESSSGFVKFIDKQA